MVSGVVVPFAAAAGLAAVLLCLFVLVLRRKSRRESSVNVPQVRAAARQSAVAASEASVPRPVQVATPVPPEPVRQAPQPITTEPEVLTVTMSDVTVSSISEAPKPPVILNAQPITNQDDHNQRILAGISENIRKSAVKPVPTYSPLQYPETQRDTEYVRIKKKIITPHGQVRFSILKDAISTNMLAIFRRACMDWKTPNDLISFLPPYLEPEAEILNNQLLLVGTPGHNEKLAIPIRSFALDSHLRDCFDFVTDGRTATNTPAVLITSDDEFEIVSKGVITQPVFLNPAERGNTEVKLLVGKTFAMGGGASI